MTIHVLSNNSIYSDGLKVHYVRNVYDNDSSFFWKTDLYKPTQALLF